MTNNSIALIFCTLLLSACGQPPAENSAGTDLATEAQRIAASSIIVDTHVDAPMLLVMRPADISVAAPDRQFDYPRAKTGGLNAPFMSIYTDAKLEASGGSFAAAEKLIDAVEATVNSAPEKFAIALSPADVREQFAAGLISLPMGMENGSPINGDLENIQYFHDRGIRYITLAHSLSNHISDSSFDKNRQWNGLSDFGVKVVEEMNRVGIMVDISHLSDDAIRHVLDITAVPAIASHSSARHFTPGYERNMSDDLISLLAENRGVIQINFGSSFITAEAQQYGAKLMAAGRAFRAENPDMSYAELREHFLPPYEAENGTLPFASLDDVLDHFDHVVNLAGIDHVGIGSDFDGVGDSLPTGLKDVADYPNLIEGLLNRGYSEDDIRKVLGENLLRVWSEVEAYAASSD